MPIDVTCSCGRNARVKDDMAGKRAKCPGCGNVFTIPQSPPQDAEESAFALLQESDKEAGQAQPASAEEKKPREDRPEPIPLAAEPPKTKPPKKRKMQKIEYETREESTGPPRVVLSPGVAAAVGMIVFGAIITAIRVDSGRPPIYGVIMIGLGVIRLVKGLLGMEEE